MGEKAKQRNKERSHFAFYKKYMLSFEV